MPQGRELRVADFDDEPAGVCALGDVDAHQRRGESPGGPLGQVPHREMLVGAQPAERVRVCPIGRDRQQLAGVQVDPVLARDRKPRVRLARRAELDELIDTGRSWACARRRRSVSASAATQESQPSSLAGFTAPLTNTGNPSSAATRSMSSASRTTTLRGVRSCRAGYQPAKSVSRSLSAGCLGDRRHGPCGRARAPRAGLTEQHWHWRQGRARRSRFTRLGVRYDAFPRESGVKHRVRCG